MVGRDAARIAITAGGVGMAIVLNLFLLALYAGIRDEGNGWVSTRPVDAWVVGPHTTNFIKSSSLLRAGEAAALRAEPAVASATPVLRLIAQLEGTDRPVTAIVIGLEPASADGRPDVVEGAAGPGRGEIVLDRALARLLDVALDDSLLIQGQRFRVTGLSRGTNSIMTQLAFVSIEDAQAMLGLRDVVSYFLVRGVPGIEPEALAARLRERAPRAAVITQRDFARNNMDELRGGLLPVLATVAVLGAAVAVAVLALLLYGSVIEQREDYALLKALGAPTRTIVRVVLAQALAAVAGGFLLGLAAYALAVPVAWRLVPVVTLALSPGAVAIIGACALGVAVAGALLPLNRIARIHPAEVFRA
jgi:putative ABC transport system permease protein